MKKTEGTAGDEIERLLEHADPREARLALKLEGVTPHHLALALHRAVHGGTWTQKLGHQYDDELGNAVFEHPAINKQVLDIAVRHALDDENAERDMPNGWYMPGRVLEKVVGHPLFDNEHADSIVHALTFKPAFKRRAYMLNGVARNIAKHPVTPPDAIRRLLYNNYTGQVDEIAKLLSHPNANADVHDDYFRRIVSGDVTAPYMISASKAFPEAFHNGPVSEETLRHMAEAYLDQNRRLSGSASEVLGMAFSHSRMPHDIIDHVINHALSPTPGVREQFAIDKVIANHSLSDAHLHRLIGMPDRRFAQATLAKNPALKTEHIEEILKRGPDGFRSGFVDAMSHPSATEDQVRRAYDKLHGTHSLASFLQHNPRVPRDILEKAFTESAAMPGGSYVRSAVLANPSVDTEMLKNIVQKLPENADYYDVREILRHRAVNQDVANKLLEHPNDDIRRAVISERLDLLGSPGLYKLLQARPHDQAIASAALAHHNLGPEHIHLLMASAPTPQERLNRLHRVVKMEDAPVEYLDEAMRQPERDPDEAYPSMTMESIWHDVLEHPNHTEEHVRQGLNGVMPNTRFRALSSRKATPEMIRAFMTDAENRQKTGYARAVSKNPSTPSDILHQVVVENGHHMGVDFHRDVLNHPNVSYQTLRTMRDFYGPKPQKWEKEFVQHLDRALPRHGPDVHHKESVVARIGKGLTGKLRMVRDLILEKNPGKREMSPKDLPPGDWSVGRLPNGNISADLIQQHIDSIPGMRYNISHGRWGTSKETLYQRHSPEAQKVFQLNLTDDHIRQIKEAGLWQSFINYHNATMGIHPNTPTTMGWVRYTGSNKLPPAKPAASDWANMAEAEFKRVTPLVNEKIGALPPEEAEEVQAAKENFFSHLKLIDNHFNNSSISNEQSEALAAQHIKENSLDKHPYIQHVRRLADKKAFDSKKAVSRGMPGIFVDEVQSDWSLAPHKRAVAEAREQAVERFKDVSDPEERKRQTDAFVEQARERAEARWPEAHHNKIVNIVFGGRHPTEVLGEAFMQHLRDKGWHETHVHWHSSDSKKNQLSKLGWLDPDHPAPPHMKLGYDEVPKKMGFQPSTYGVLDTQRKTVRTDKETEVAAIHGDRTWASKVRKYEEDVKDWLRKALHPADFGDISRNSFANGHEAVDHRALMKAHPDTVEPHRLQYRQRIHDSKKLHVPVAYNTGGVTKKLIYKAKHPEGEHRVMIKPFHEIPIARLDRVYPHPLAGWAESTSQSLYHSAGIGDLHQKVHIDEHHWGEHDGIEHGMKPGVVVHMESGFDDVQAAGHFEAGDHVNEQARRIALMDFLTGNGDRHDGNLMISKDRDKLLAIDHGFAFQYMQPTLRAEKHKLPDDQIHTRFEDGFVDMAPHTITGHNISHYDAESERIAGRDAFTPTFKWWSTVGDKVRDAFHKNLEAITDHALREHVRRNFEARADWLDKHAKNGLHKASPDWASEKVPQFRYGTPTTAAPVAPGASTRGDRKRRVG